MAFNGSGTFVRLYNWVADALAAIKIRADRMDAEMDGMATGLSNCVTRDGQSPATANLPMGGFKHTGVASATARDHYPSVAQIQDGSLTHVTPGGVAGTGDATTLTPSPTLLAYVEGMVIEWEVENVNTGAVTLNVSGLGAKDLKYLGYALTAGVLAVGDLVTAKYDGTAFQVISVTRIPRFDKVGIGMAPVNILDLTQSGVNGSASIKLLNANAGAAVYAAAILSNGTNDASLLQFGTNWTTAGVDRQDGARLNGGGAGGLSVGTSLDQPVYFYTQATERMRLTSANGGALIIGATAVGLTEKFLVVQPDTAELTASLTNSHGTPGAATILSLGYNASPDDNVALFLRCVDGTTNRLLVYADGDVQNHDNSYGAISARLLKQDIVSMPSRWDVIKSIRLRQYKMREDVQKLGEAAPVRFGVIADEIAVDAPQLVKNSEYVIYSHLYTEAVRALQEAMARIEALEAKVP